MINLYILVYVSAEYFSRSDFLEFTNLIAQNNVWWSFHRRLTFTSRFNIQRLSDNQQQETLYMPTYLIICDGQLEENGWAHSKGRSLHIIYQTICEPVH